TDPQQQNDETDLAAFEKQKIKGAIRTDFILSAEIVVISLGTVAAAAFMTKVMVLSIIAIVMTVGVYGFVAMIVKIDDLGLYWTKQSSSFKQKLGNALLVFAPWLMKALSVVGTIAMFLVGGGIIAHTIPLIHHFSEETSDHLEMIPTVGNIIGAITPTLINFGIGMLAGLIVFMIVTVFQKMKAKAA
ncbi:DUF808 family protein, partial [Acinetobacter soli]